MTDHPIPIVRVETTLLQRLFNEGQYWQRAQAGELSIVLLEDRHPSLTLANEPFCTRSQMVSYREGTVEIARVHQYLRTDGSIGASGKPDPKRLYAGGKLYRLIKTPKEPSVY
jgi:hypothetical protein